MSLIIAALTIIVGLLSKEVKQKWSYVLWVLLAEYTFVVICFTIICRGTQTFIFARLELTPFWIYKAVKAHIPGVSVWDILLNVVMFIPLGLLVKLLFPKVTWIKMLLIAILSSLFIEMNQYIFEKGFAQIDDVIHNAIGALIGNGIAYYIQKMIKTLYKCQSLKTKSS